MYPNNGRKKTEWWNDNSKSAMKDIEMAPLVA